MKIWQFQYWARIILATLLTTFIWEEKRIFFVEKLYSILKRKNGVTLKLKREFFMTKFALLAFY